jgi:hypothetical protein
VIRIVAYSKQSFAKDDYSTKSAAKTREDQKMVVATVKQDVFTEVYPIIVENLPLLAAWRLDAPENDAAMLGQKLAHRLRIRQRSRWIWSQGHLITDAVLQPSEAMDFLKALWSEDDEAFKLIRSMRVNASLKPSIQSLADFVAFGVVTDLDKSIRELLRKYRATIRNATVERDYEVQGWNVDGKPAISVTVYSHIISATTLPKYISTKVQKLDDIVGLLVGDKMSNLRGEISEIVGTLADHRQTLIDKSSRESMKKFIAEAPDNDLVVHIRTSAQKGYDYPSSALKIIASTAQYHDLEINGQEALSALQIKPAPRYEMVQQIVALFGQLGYISTQPYNTSDYPKHFLQGLDEKLNIKALLGNGVTCECNPLAVLNALRKHPLYRRSDLIAENAPMRLAVLNMIGDNPSIPKYLNEIRKVLSEIRFKVEFTGAERPSPKVRLEIEKAVEQIREQKPHLVMVFVPGDAADGESHSDLYLQLKSILLDNDLQSQVIYQSTTDNNYAVNNIILGVLAKTGNVPYVLNKPLPYTDLIVGIDISRERNQRSRGSTSMAAMTRIYASNGDFLKFNIVDAPVEGETLTNAVIHKLFPSREFEGKRCVIHRDGLFRGDEKANLKKWAQEIGATFYLVEVIKSRVPRLYLEEYERIQRPAKGDAFVLNAYEAFLVSSLPPSKTSTPRPLFVRTEGDFSIEDALHSVLALTHLHYGSVPMPRLPVTLHYSDQIGYLVLRGVRPRSVEGTIPFWI